MSRSIGITPACLGALAIVAALPGMAFAAAKAPPAAAAVAPPVEVGHGGPVGQAPPSPTLEFGAEGAAGSGPDLGVVPEGAQPVDALPLSRFVGADAKASAARGPQGLWGLFSRARDGGLPEPASWALMLIGFGMIGAALRGFIVANRRLARLQPEDPDGPAEG
jgi:hypothetical protein